MKSYNPAHCEGWRLCLWFSPHEATNQEYIQRPGSAWAKSLRRIQIHWEMHGNVLYQLAPLCLSWVKPQAVHHWCSKPTASFTTSDPNYCHTQRWLDLWRLDVSLTAQETHFSDLMRKHECMIMYAKTSKISSKHLKLQLPATCKAAGILHLANCTEHHGTSTALISDSWLSLMDSRESNKVDVSGRIRSALSSPRTSRPFNAINSHALWFANRSAMGNSKECDKSISRIVSHSSVKRLWAVPRKALAPNRTKRHCPEAADALQSVSAGKGQSKVLLHWWSASSKADKRRPQSLQLLATAKRRCGCAMLRGFRSFFTIFTRVFFGPVESMACCLGAMNFLSQSSTCSPMCKACNIPTTRVQTKE